MKMKMIPGLIKRKLWHFLPHSKQRFQGEKMQRRLIVSMSLSGSLWLSLAPSGSLLLSLARCPALSGSLCFT